MGSTRQIAGIVALYAVFAGTGCASAELTPAQTTVTSAQVPAPAAKEASASPEDRTARDGELGGNEHHLSLLEGRLIAKLHAVETPVIKTRASTNGTLYTSVEAKLGDDQVVYCSAYAASLWPGALAAADLRGEHDWADKKPKTDAPDAREAPKPVEKIDGTKIAVTSVNGRPTLWGRATIRNEANQVVADRKVAVVAAPTFTFLCSDSTPGYRKRFVAFVEETLKSIKVDPPSAVTPKSTALYRIDANGLTVGYNEVRTYVDPKGVTTTFSHETFLRSDETAVAALDATTVATMNARGEETEIRYESAVDGAPAQRLVTTRDAKGWVMKGQEAGSTIEARLSAKAPIVTPGAPSWNNRLRAVAAKKSAQAKVSVLGMKQHTAMPVVVKRRADGVLAFTLDNLENEVTMDADGVRTWSYGNVAKLERLASEGK